MCQGAVKVREEWEGGGVLYIKKSKGVKVEKREKTVAVFEKVCSAAMSDLLVYVTKCWVGWKRR